VIVKASLVKGDDGFPFFSISSNINIFGKLVLLKLIVLFLIHNATDYQRVDGFMKGSSSSLNVYGN